MRNLDRFGSNPTVQVWPISPRARRLLPLESAPPPIRRRLPPPSAATFFPVPLPRGNFALFTLPQLLLPPPPRPQPPNPSWPAPSSPPPGDRRSPETRKKLSAARSYSYREAYISSAISKPCRRCDEHAGAGRVAGAAAVSMEGWRSGGRPTSSVNRGASSGRRWISCYGSGSSDTVDDRCMEGEGPSGGEALTKDKKSRRTPPGHGENEEHGRKM
ncbi:hypothetical protein DAI22_11g144250 [Oryza sativa Japonica Group]|nr:hypothetical protein DAI22_11g144250 [Oryza sativa Japonica Group]